MVLSLYICYCIMSVNPQDTPLQQGTTACVALLRPFIERACGLCRLLWLFGRVRRGSGEASAEEQLSNIEHSHGAALIYNIHLLVEGWPWWKRYIDWALDKLFNGCVARCGMVDWILIKHRLVAHVSHVWRSGLDSLFSPGFVARMRSCGKLLFWCASAFKGFR